MSDDKFWILPLHPAAESSVRPRTDSILNRANPPIPAIP